jgi:hypothetical protein
MTQQKHTPTPWTLEWECEDTGILKDANGEHITHINGSRYFDDRQDEIAHENAAFIVRACNSHYELLASLKACLEVFGDDANGFIVKKARDAIAMAEGGAA